MHNDCHSYTKTQTKNTHVEKLLLQLLLLRLLLLLLLVLLLNKPQGANKGAHGAKNKPKCN